MDFWTDIATRVSRDVTGAGLALDIALYDLRRKDWLAGGGTAPEGFGDEGYVLVLPGRQKLVELLPTGEPDPVDVVSQVQDWVIDELGVSWPEAARPDGSYGGLLTPIPEGDGVLWSTSNGPAIAIGDLPSSRGGASPVE